MMKRLILLSMMSIIIVLFAACGNEETLKETEQVEVVNETQEEVIGNEALENEELGNEELVEEVSVPEEVIVPWKVFTSFYVMEDFVKKIGGERVEVTNMIPCGFRTTRLGTDSDGNCSVRNCRFICV
jgi:ABC-type Zn uptake system ZnuABC Zn-binding protein ZnuA